MPWLYFLNLNLIGIIIFKAGLFTALFCFCSFVYNDASESQGQISHTPHLLGLQMLYALKGKREW